MSRTDGPGPVAVRIRLLGLDFHAYEPTAG